MSQGGAVDRLRGMEHTRTIVIGGGLAGLTAAATLARGGHAVTVVEGAEHLGGRARSRHRDGFDLNTGPARPVPDGGRARRPARPRRRRPRQAAAPRPRRRLGRRGGRSRSAATCARNVGDRARVVKAMAGLGTRAAAEWTGRPASEWIESVTDDEQGRLLLASLIRTTTYSADTTLLDAGAVTSPAAHRHARGAVPAPRVVEPRRRGSPTSSAANGGVLADRHAGRGGRARRRACTACASPTAARCRPRARGRRRQRRPPGRRPARRRRRGPRRRPSPRATVPVRMAHLDLADAAAAVAPLHGPARHRRRDLRHRAELRRRTWPPTAATSSRSPATCAPARSTATTGRASKRSSTPTSRTGATTSSTPATSRARS